LILFGIQGLITVIINTFFSSTGAISAGNGNFAPFQIFRKNRKDFPFAHYRNSHKGIFIVLQIQE
jgi:hypothetical protein